jgi:hypothetical protein
MGFLFDDSTPNEKARREGRAFQVLALPSTSKHIARFSKQAMMALCLSAKECAGFLKARPGWTAQNSIKMNSGVSGAGSTRTDIAQASRSTRLRLRSGIAGFFAR